MRFQFLLFSLHETTIVNQQPVLATFVLDPQRFGAVLDALESMLARKGDNEIHVTRVTIEMDRHDGLGLTMISII
jgi:hypothetical protein